MEVQRHCHTRARVVGLRMKTPTPSPFKPWTHTSPLGFAVVTVLISLAKAGCLCADDDHHARPLDDSCTSLGVHPQPSLGPW